MNKLLAKIKNEQLKERKNYAVDKSAVSKMRSKLLTYFLGELERSTRLEDLSEDDTIRMLKTTSEKLLDEQEKEYLNTFVPQTYSLEWHNSYVNSIVGEDESITEVKHLMKRVSEDKRDGLFEKIVDRGMLRKIFEENY